MMWWILCSRKLKNGRCGVLRLTGIQTNARNSSNAMQAEQRKEQRRHIPQIEKNISRKIKDKAKNPVTSAGSFVNHAFKSN